jgi:steroid delta-isomerase-like uncharacterized protein
MATNEENKATVRRWFNEVVSQGDIAGVDQICFHCVPSFVVIRGAFQTPPQGLDGVKGALSDLRQAFPDLTFNIIDQIAEDDKVATRLTITGTHKGEFMGIPPTGKTMNVAGTSIWYLTHEGKLLTENVNWDTLSMMQQLGVIPS